MISTLQECHAKLRAKQSIDRAKYKLKLCWTAIDVQDKVVTFADLATVDWFDARYMGDKL